MLKKNRVFSSLLSLILVVALSFGSDFMASGETVERYKTTGGMIYCIMNAGGFESIANYREITDGYVERFPDKIIFYCSHNDREKVHLEFVKLTTLNWKLITFNNIDYSNYNIIIDNEPIFSDRSLSFYQLLPENTNNLIRIDINFYDLRLEPISDINTISNGQYKGTGTASVETTFGTFNLGNLAKTKINAVVTDNQLDLSFQAKNIPYQVQANLDSVDSDGTAIYTYSDQNESWQITVTPDGKLDGSLTYTGDRGTMNFSINLTSK